MFNRIRLRASAAIAGLFIPNLDRIVGGLDSMIASLDRAVDRAQARIDAEQNLRAASYARQQAMIAAERGIRAASLDRDVAAFEVASRASRVRERVRSLIA